MKKRIRRSARWKRPGKTLLMALLMLLSGMGSYAQSILEKKVSANFAAASLAQRLKDLQQQTGVTIAFDESEIGHLTIPAARFSNLPLKDALQETLASTPYDWKQAGESVVVMPRHGKQQSPAPAVSTGRVTGRVIDEESGEPLFGATVVLGGKGVTTDENGQFSISLPKGNYTAAISYVGYIKKEVTQIQVKENQVYTLNASLKRKKGQLGTVVVRSSARKESVASLYIRQKNAASVTDGISAEQIARTPDNDMGQALKRITGLTTVDNKNVVVRGMSERYNQAMMDGIVIPSTSMNKRNFSFDIIPVEIVNDVTVNKTATPDKSSEFSGGQVSINTIDIPAKNFTTITLGTGGNSQTTGKDFYRLGERHGSEYFGFYPSSSKKPEGILTWYWNNRAVQLDAPPGVSDDPELSNETLSFENQHMKYNDLDAIAQSRRINNDPLKLHRYKGALNQNYRLAIGRVFQLKNEMRFGFVVSANARNEQNVMKYNNVRGSSNGGYHFIDSTGLGHNGAGVAYRFNSTSGLVANVGLDGKKFKLALKNIYARTFNDNFNEAVRMNYYDLTHPPTRELYQLPEAMAIRQHQLTAEYQLPGGIKMEAMGAVNVMDQQILDERKLKYRLTAELGGKGYFQSPNLYTLSQAGGTNLEDDHRMWGNTEETDYNWSLNFSKVLGKETDFSTMVKTGYQGWNKHRTLDLLRMVPMARSVRAGESFPPVEGTYENILAPENIGWGPGMAYYYADMTYGRMFDGRMKNHAMYLMADQKLWKKLRLVYGARLEYYDLSNRQEEALNRQFGDNIPAHLTYRKGVNEKDWRLLPSANLIYSLTNTFNIRSSYSKTAIRPDFRESGMFGMWDNELGGVISGDYVESTIIDNVDLRFEWYPGPGEIISLTGYYKHLDKPIELVRNTSFPNSTYYIYTNMESATNMGLEMELRKNFSFLGKQDWLSDLFIYANGTLLKSTVKVLGPWHHDPADPNSTDRIKTRYEDQDRPLIGQSPWLINLGLGYWGDHFGATVNYNHRGYRTNLTAIDFNVVEFELAPRQLDFQVYKRFFKQKMEVKLNMANLLNEWTNYYTNTEGYRSESNVWVRNKGNDDYSKDDGDTIVFRKREGRRFNFSFTYSF